MPTVSIIIPVYNSGEKLHKCIRSLQKQTFEDIEIILINDGSTDHSLAICERYYTSDSRITIISTENNGSIAARNRGMEEATAPYLMFVDADDWVSPHIVQTLLEALIKNECDLSVCNIYKVLGGHALIKKENPSLYFQNDRLYTGEEVKNELAAAYFHGHPFPSALYAKLYKKELVKNKGTYLQRIQFLGDDLFFNLEIFLEAKRVKLINQPLYYYRSGGATSKFMPSLFWDSVNGYEIQKEVITEHYTNSKDEHMAGISLMLLNTFKTVLMNMMKNNATSEERLALIADYCHHPSLRETLNHSRSIQYFTTDYLQSIAQCDTQALYAIGENMHKQSRMKECMKRMLAALL
ncbi:glycosyl transferase family protein [Fictibacillus macauensis ZFHKF-1]|uniref:Glycosyl transferase family protein n=1 Tax=Fictibacillus macauensis ZFHKF-1 TaxID=1196324 RepID=I8AL86_9BACL|nr:glycosyltransferase family 2 protein [Fictibacillus macauensis]EIT86642.1 glycosyl transferase family protein [Fictibacillus macauensis ZFHKF-1]